MKKLFFLALFPTIFLSSCVEQCDCVVQSFNITITEIPDEYNEQLGKIRMGDMKGTINRYVQQRKLEFDIIYDSLEINVYNPVILLLEDNTFIYTEGNSFEELQIDVCSITDIKDCDMQYEDIEKLPKVDFHATMYGLETTIKFNQFQKVVCD